MPTNERAGNAMALPLGAAAAPASVTTRPIAEPGIKEETMRIPLNADIVRVIEDLTTEQEEILRNIPEPPPAENHASIAILEGWADGIISTQYVEAYMTDYAGCAECQDNYAFYKALRAETITEPR